MHFVVIAIVALIFVFFFAYPAWLKAATRRRRAIDPDYSPPRPLAIVDELYHPDSHATRQIVEDERVIPAKAPLRERGKYRRSVPVFSPDVVSAVLAHMNGDHLDDNLLIARAFGSVDAESATMTALDENGATFTYAAGGEQHSVTVAWSATIAERPEIRREVVVLYERACAELGITPRPHV